MRLPAGTIVQDAAGWFVYPGLVNTHHHFFQCFVRNRADLDWTKLSVIEWLDRIYPIFSQLDRGLASTIPRSRQWPS